MICFFASDPLLDGAVNPTNGLLDELKQSVPENANVLFIASDPAGSARTDFHSAVLRRCFENSGFRFSQFINLDDRNAHEAERRIREADFLVLSGGHVPTQNDFFHRIGLKDLLEGFQGTLLGISAGTMNSAETVYVHPEREGEALDQDFRRFREGLRLTKVMVLPHYQSIKNDVLDGLRVFEDIAYPDSMGRKFYALVDGSYILSREGEETLRGEAWLIENGEIRQITSEGDILPL